MLNVTLVQFSPFFANVAESIRHLDQFLAVNTVDINPHTSLTTPATSKHSLLILPEMTLCGYSFHSRQHIEPFLESYLSPGQQLSWGICTAKKLHTHLIMGYPERDLTTDKLYNSAVVISSAGQILKNYRKSQLYEVDEAWAEEGDGFTFVVLPGLGKCGLGICMDLSPKAFKAPWDAFEVRGGG